MPSLLLQTRLRLDMSILVLEGLCCRFVPQILLTLRVRPRTPFLDVSPFPDVTQILQGSECISPMGELDCDVANRRLRTALRSQVDSVNHVPEVVTENGEVSCTGMPNGDARVADRRGDGGVRELSLPDSGDAVGPGRDRLGE